MNRIFARRRVDLMEQLVEQAFFRGFMTGSPDYHRVKKLIESGADWPDDLKPGALIGKLTPEQRELLADLTPADLDHRVDSIPFLRRS
jgi:hypothetical protein